MAHREFRRLDGFVRRQPNFCTRADNGVDIPRALLHDRFQRGILWIRIGDSDVCHPRHLKDFDGVARRCRLVRLNSVFHVRVNVENLVSKAAFIPWILHHVNLLLGERISRSRAASLFGRRALQARTSGIRQDNLIGGFAGDGDVNRQTLPTQDACISRRDGEFRRQNRFGFLPRHQHPQQTRMNF